MAQLFSSSANSLSKLFVAGFVLAAIACSALATTAVRSSFWNGVGNGIEQPVPFSHQHHVSGLGLDCRFCHTSVERASEAGFPDTATCMGCHSQIWPNAPALAPVRDSFRFKTPLHWRQVTQLPDYVYFNHQAHVQKGVACTTCHGPVERMPVVFQARTFFMKDCLECHENPGPYHVAPKRLTDCNECHR